MTKYVLHGGYEEKMIGDDRKFYAEIVKGLSEPVKILLIFYAIQNDRWGERFRIIKNNFAYSTEKMIEFTIADVKVNKLIEQIKKSNVIYIRGGDSLPLVSKLKKVKNLKELFEGKVVMGASAGCYALGKYYYSRRRDKFLKGLGILPIKFMCHYAEELKDKWEKFKKYKENLPILILKENKFVVMKK